MTVHLTLGAPVFDLSGYGQATPSKKLVKIELRDPGELAVLRRRTIRDDRPITVIPITRMWLAVNSVQLSRGGNWVGGGVGITGALTGAAMAGALNRLSHQRWEETLLHVMEAMPSGAARRVSFSFPTYTPDRLLAILGPGLDACADSFVAAVVNGAITPFDDCSDLTRTYEQIDLMLGRNMLAESHAATLCAHLSQPFLTAIHTRLRQHQLSYEAAQRTARELIRLRAQHRVTDNQVAPLRTLLQQIPSPGDQAEIDAERERLIDQLTDLRRTGAITEDELRAETARLRLR